jgi:hypothetical protein
MSRILKCCLILEGMNFLGIPSENFSKMKNKFGGIDEFYEFISNELG